eukprot:2705438-Rhodomonas_salina.3
MGRSCGWTEVDAESKANRQRMLVLPLVKRPPGDETLHALSDSSVEERPLRPEDKQRRLLVVQRSVQVRQAMRRRFVRTLHLHLVPDLVAQTLDVSITKSAASAREGKADHFGGDHQH